MPPPQTQAITEHPSPPRSSPSQVGHPGLLNPLSVFPSLPGRRRAPWRRPKLAVARCRSPPWRHLHGPPPLELRRGFDLPWAHLPFPPDPGRRHALGCRRRPPPAPWERLPCSAGMRKGKERAFCPKAPPFLINPLRALSLSSILQNKPFFHIPDKPFHLIRLILTKPLPLSSIL